MRAPVIPMQPDELQRITDRVTGDILLKYRLELDMVKIKSKKRTPDLVVKRALFARHAKEMGYSCVQIAQMINRDHSVVIYLIGHAKHAKKQDSFEFELANIVPRAEQIQTIEPPESKNLLYLL